MNNGADAAVHIFTRLVHFMYAPDTATPRLRWMYALASPSPVHFVDSTAEHNTLSERSCTHRVSGHDVMVVSTR